MYIYNLHVHYVYVHDYAGLPQYIFCVQHIESDMTHNSRQTTRLDNYPSSLAAVLKHDLNTAIL